MGQHFADEAQRGHSFHQVSKIDLGGFKPRLTIAKV